jgi:hypothetical protein
MRCRPESERKVDAFPPRAGLVVLVILVCLIGRPCTSTAGTWSWGVSPSAGGLLLDVDLENYRWDVRPHGVWGGELWAARGHWEAGIAIDRARTSQSTGIPGESFAPQVTLSTLSSRLRFVPGARWGLEPVLELQAGRMHAGYDPERAELDLVGGAGPITVRYEPLDAWRLGTGVGIRHWMSDRLALGLHVERTSFALETLHRNGEDIEERRERFGNWQWRVQIAVAPSGRRR